MAGEPHSDITEISRPTIHDVDIRPVMAMEDTKTNLQEDLDQLREASSASALPVNESRPVAVDMETTEVRRTPDIREIGKRVRERRESWWNKVVDTAKDYVSAYTSTEGRTAAREKLNEWDAMKSKEIADKTKEIATATVKAGVDITSALLGGIGASMLAPIAAGVDLASVYASVPMEFGAKAIVNSSTWLMEKGANAMADLLGGIGRKEYSAGIRELPKAEWRRGALVGFAEAVGNAAENAGFNFVKNGAERLKKLADTERDALRIKADLGAGLYGAAIYLKDLARDVREGRKIANQQITNMGNEARSFKALKGLGKAIGAN